MNGGPIGRLSPTGVFELDGGSWEVDNNIWVVGDDSQVVGDPHPRTLPRVGMLACPRTGRRVLRRHPVRGRPRCHRPVLLRLPHHPRIHLEPTRHATRRHRRLHRPRRLHHHRRRNHPLRRMGHPRPLHRQLLHVAAHRLADRQCLKPGELSDMLDAESVDSSPPDGFHDGGRNIGGQEQRGGFDESAIICVRA